MALIRRWHRENDPVHERHMFGRVRLSEKQHGGRKVVKVDPKKWGKTRVGITLRLPLPLREALIEESHVKGDLAGIVLFALDHVDKEHIAIIQTRKAGLPLAPALLLHIGNEARTMLKEWAEEESVGANAIVVSVLDDFFKRLKRSKDLREELKLYLRARRNFAVE